MKRYILTIFILSAFLTLGYSDCPPGGGYDENGFVEDTHTYDGDSASTTAQRSWDPNELIGPYGYDSAKWISINDVLNYTIYFENSPDFATAPAQNIDIRFRFPQRNMMNSFTIGNYSFANQTFSQGIGGAFCRTRLDLRDTMNLYVDMIAGLDVENISGFWRFTSIDPVSGYAIYEADRGLLPINDSTHIGEGFVTFSLMPSPTMRTGDTLSLIANILFDQNDTIPTNRWCNRIDAGAPVSQVFAHQDEHDNLLYHLSFAAQDDNGGSGIKHIILYATDYLGMWQEIGAFPMDTTIDYQVEPGLVCSLMSIGEDMVGNREAFKSTADTILNNVLPPLGLTLSDDHFSDDLPQGGYIATLTTLNAKDGESFVYALAEGDSAIHNDLFDVAGDRLVLREPVNCTDQTNYFVRLSTTNNGGKTYSKAFTLTKINTLIKPQPDTIAVSICDGEIFTFKNTEYKQAGQFTVLSENDFMCDSTYILQIALLPTPAKPSITLEKDSVLVSSISSGNQWYNADGEPISGATDQRFVPAEDGDYYVISNNGVCVSKQSDLFTYRVPQYFTLALLSNDTIRGSVYGSGVYAGGTEVEITALPNTGYTFLQWSDGITDMQRTITIDTNITLTAIFGSQIGTATDVNIENLISVEGQAININAPDGTKVSVYTVVGQLIYQGTNHHITLPQTGQYIINIDNNTIRLTIK